MHFSALCIEKLLAVSSQLKAQTLSAREAQVERRERELQSLPVPARGARGEVLWSRSEVQAAIEERESEIREVLCVCVCMCARAPCSFRCV